MRDARGSATPSAQTILAEVGGAILGGILGAVVIGGAIYLVAGLLFAQQLGMGLLTVGVLGASFGFGVGAGLGTALVGRAFQQGGNLWLAPVAGGLSAVIALFGMRLLNLGGLGELLIVGLLLPLVVVVVVYNLQTRR
ncbi:hypothetical protein [Candidatus Chloroploca asiatica]|uniref:Uncharacterized protein n=1 Tax=Candidatus Chloroploca asiatica TaxID=1506545 RepID=A0A2H3KRA9_9CHLR|nr:hypothetical protein [Candidatus Chloroploca asiatica]PDV97734.1 hypothetical protein A9Q02_17745 [Candidatus Chloroploca asiatica]